MKMFCFLLATFLTINSYSQHEGEHSYVFKHIGSEDGLSQSIVVDIEQDGDGFLWFGTYNGLNRFDGHSIKAYKSTDDTTQLSSYYIRTLFIDSKGILWAASNTGLGFYSKTHDKIIDLCYKTKFPSGIDQVEDVLEDKNGVIWIASTSGLYKYNRTENSLNRVTPRYGNDFPYLKITNIELAVNGYIYLTALDGLYILNTSTLDVELLATLRNKNYIHGEHKESVIRMCSDSTGNLWLGSSIGNLYTFNVDTDSLSQVNLPQTPIINDVYADSDTSILIGLDNIGLLRYFTKTNTYEYIYDKFNPDKKLANNKARSMFVDKQNILWVGHFQAGLSYTNLDNSGFELLTKLNYNNNAVTLNTVSAILNDSKGNLWIGLDGGGLIRKYSNSRKFEHYVNKPADKTSLPSNAVLELFEDSQGVVWIGTYRGGLTRYEEKTNTFTSYTHKENRKNSIASNDVRKIAEDGKGNFWLIVHGSGISYFNRTTEEFTNYKLHEDGSNSLVNNWTFDLLLDCKGYLWITSSKGVSRYDIENDYFYNYLEDMHDTTSIPIDFVNCIHEDSNGNLWLGSDNGLLYYNYETDRFHRVSQHTALWYQSIYAMEEHNNQLWISTTNGLFQFDTKTNVTRKFTIEDGLQGDEFIVGSSFKDKVGRLYFGGINGLNIFQPKNIKTNTLPPSIEILQVENMGKPIEQHLLFEKNTYAYNENFLTFHFVALNFQNSEKNEYRYTLDGLNEKWSLSTNECKAVYTSLPPGNYIFKVIASNNSGVWNEKATKFEFEILPPWYATWWFRVVFILIVLGSIVGFSFLKIRNINKQKNILERKVFERTKQLKQSNDELEERNHEVKTQNELLVEKQEEIIMANEELKSLNEQLADHEIELMQKNEQLKDLVNTKDKMLSIIAHDLKNPMNTLIGFSSLLMGKVKVYPVDKVEKFITLINQSSNNAYKLLENLLTWARSQTGNIKLDIKKESLIPLIEETISILHESANNKNITLQFYNHSAHETQAFVDANTVSTIIRNIISNAIKFTPKGGHIAVSLLNNTKDTHMEIKICDSGVGISEEQKTKLFKVSKNNSTQGTENETGTGLGLVICKEFADMNNGMIEVESEKDKGTCFKIFLPKKLK